MLVCVLSRFSCVPLFSVVSDSFLLSFISLVPEPMTLPQILSRSSSVTPNWCDVTLECKASENREDLKVTWESKGLPRELECRRTLGPAANSWS